MGWVDPMLEEAIRAHLQGKDFEGAATAAIRGYGPQVLGYLTAVLRDEVLADEAFSTFSEKLWKSLPRFRGASSFGTWAYKIAWSAAKHAARTRGRGVPLTPSMISQAAEVVRTNTAIHIRTDAKSAVAKLREELSSSEQTLLILRVDRQLSWDDVAEVMGGDPATARKRFERVKGKLRALAKARGLGAGG